MKLNKFLVIPLTLGLVSCGAGEEPAPGQENQDTMNTVTELPETPPPSLAEEQLRIFLHSTEGTYGWQTMEDEIMLDFFVDGRLAIQGPDGEATMWEGTWTLVEDQVTMDRTDLGEQQTVTAKRDGEFLILGDKRYTRYMPAF